jgi:hypothetical protein
MTADTKVTKATKITRTKADFKDKLKKLEIEKLNIISKRKEEILKLIENLGCLTIDNELIVGALLIAKEIDAKEHKSNKQLPDYLKDIESHIKEKAQKFFRKKSKSDSAS